MKTLQNSASFAATSFMARSAKSFNLCGNIWRHDVVRYGDGYYRRTIYGIGPYIADYPEQVLLACVLQGWCPRWESTLSFTFMSLMLCRCDAKWDNLIDNDAGRRSHKLTCSLAAALDKKALWDDYGIVNDIMV